MRLAAGLSQDPLGSYSATRPPSRYNGEGEGGKGKERVGNSTEGGRGGKGKT